jgi:signal transduction histidine kinase/ligand-binding sensor domain-containing protein
MLNRSAPSIRCLSVFPVFIILSLLLFCFHPGFSQERATPVIFPVTAYNVEDGLDQSMVYQVIQDSRGLIWVVSGAGLQYFDGFGFRSFYPPDQLAMTFTGNTMHGIVETSPGNLVTSTGSSVLSFNSSTGTFKIIEQKIQHFPKLFSLFYENRPFCWMASDGLYLVGEHQLYPVNLDFSPGSSLPEEFNPSNAIKTREGAFLFIYGNGYLEIRPGQGDHDTNWAAEWILMDTPCQDVFSDEAGEVYILSEGIIYLLAGKGELKEIYNTGVKDSYHLFIDRFNNFWVSDITNKRIFRVTEGKMEEIRFIIREGKHTDTIQPTVRAFFEDKRGNLWFGTDGNGLLQHVSDQTIFGLSRTGFTRCMTNYQDEIWTGTYKNGLWRLSADLTKKTQVNPEILTDELYFFDLVTDTSGRLWTATNRGIYILDRKGHVVFHKPFNTTSAKFLLLPGNILFLSTYAEFYSCKTGKEPGITFIRKQTQIRDMIIYKGCYWVCNHFGLFRKDIASSVLQTLLLYPEDRLTNVPVYSILPVDGIVWAGTERGIMCYSSDGKEIQVHQGIGELKREVIYSLLLDKQNRIWFASNKGLGCILSARDRIIRFTLRNNLQSLEFNFNADLAIPSQDRLFFGGINGINGLKTGDFTISDMAPEVGLISLFISDSAYSSGLPPEETIVNMHWDSPHFSGHVFNPDYLPAGTSVFSFFLEGYHDNWSQPSPNTMFSYRNLPPGNYRLWVKCIDSFKNEGQGKCIVNITIRPPFWKTWWFILISALVVMIVIIMIFIRAREAKYRNMLRELEQRNAIDRERLRISQDMHDEIGSSLTQVAILSEIVKKQDNPEDMMKLIDRISAISGTVVDDMSEIIWAINPKNDNLSSFTSYLRRHASEYISTAGIEGNLRFPGECPAVPMTSEQRRNIFLVVKEALHNIVKHSGADEVNLSLAWSNGMLIMHIEDNGKGFETEACADIGNGLTGMRKRIEALGGSYSINSNPGIGTRVNFSVIL